MLLSTLHGDFKLSVCHCPSAWCSALRYRNREQNPRSSGRRMKAMQNVSGPICSTALCWQPAPRAVGSSQPSMCLKETQRGLTRCGWGLSADQTSFCGIRTALGLTVTEPMGSKKNRAGVRQSHPGCVLSAPGSPPLCVAVDTHILTSCHWI